MTESILHNYEIKYLFTLHTCYIHVTGIYVHVTPCYTRYNILKHILSVFNIVTCVTWCNMYIYTCNVGVTCV